MTGFRKSSHVLVYLYLHVQLTMQNPTWIVRNHVHKQLQLLSFLLPSLYLPVCQACTKTFEKGGALLLQAQKSFLGVRA